MTDEKEKNLKNQILLKLVSLGYNLKHNGTHYLTYTIIEVIKFGDPLICVFETDIYPIIAKRFNRKVSTIKSSIYKATDFACFVQIDKIKKFFHFYDNTKPTTKEIVITIINFLEQN